MASENPAPPNLAELMREELIAIIIQQGELLAELRKQIEELLRKGARQASPFSKNKSKANPKPPGRKPGQGSFTRRPSPPEQPSDLKVQATTPERCPDCDGGLELERMDQATTIDIPKKPELVVTRYSVPVCRCKKCGKHVRGQAPGLAQDQAGATAHRVGPEVMAISNCGRNVPFWVPDRMAR